MQNIAHILGKILDFYSMFGLRGLVFAVQHKFLRKPKEVEIRAPGVKDMVTLRLKSSDFYIYKQIFVDMEYSFEATGHPEVIIDAGANIGLAAIYFANKYPEAAIIALEPEESNFRLLKKNTAPYKKITCIQCALWQDDCRLNLVNPGGGECGFQTHCADNTDYKVCHEVEGITVQKLMKDQGIGYMDILKIDIEGAEKEVFRDASGWIDKVGILIVELHDQYKAGCRRSFYNATNNFELEWQQGENVYLARTGKVPSQA
jgi:FkbM family methyltransferase